jgi:hypothetical protein
MRIQEENVKMLNEEIWDDVKLNYPYSGSSIVFEQFFVAFKKVCWFITFILFVSKLIYLYFNGYIYIYVFLFH